MTSKHNHGHNHPKHSGQKVSSGGIHKDWRAWTVVGLMLVAIAAYIMSMDESIQPGPGPAEGPVVPAEAE